MIRWLWFETPVRRLTKSGLDRLGRLVEYLTTH